MYERIADWYDVIYWEMSKSMSESESSFYKWAFSDNGIAKRKTKRILDAAAGTGRQVFMLKELGYDVTASDQSEQMLAKLKEKTANASIVIETYVKAFQELEFDSEFDAVVCAFSAFNHVIDNESVLESLRRFHSALSIGGVLVMDIINILVFLDRFERVSVDASTSNGYSFQRIVKHAIDVYGGNFTHDETVFIAGNDGKAYSYSEKFPLRTFGAHELEAWLMLAGFTDIRRFNGYGDHPGGSGAGNGGRLVYCAFKD